MENLLSNAFDMLQSNFLFLNIQSMVQVFKRPKTPLYPPKIDRRGFQHFVIKVMKNARLKKSEEFCWDFTVTSQGEAPSDKNNLNDYWNGNKWIDLLSELHTKVTQGTLGM